MTQGRAHARRRHRRGRFKRGATRRRRRRDRSESGQDCHDALRVKFVRLLTKRGLKVGKTRKWDGDKYNRIIVY